MAAGLAYEIWSSRKATIDFDGNRTYTRVFRVRTTDTLDGAIVARQAVGVPRPGDVYFDGNGNSDTAARVRSVEASQDQDDPNTWLVTAEYSTQFDENQTQGMTNPLDKPVEISGDFAMFQEGMERDTAGNSLTNTAGDKLQPTPTRDDPRLQFTVAVNRANINIPLLSSFINTINSQPFFGFQEYTLKLQNAPFSSQTENGIFFWKISYSFQVKSTGWNPTPLLMFGPNAVDADGNRYAIRDDKGDLIEDYLDLEGQRLAVGEDPVYFDFFFYVAKDFAELGLGL